MVIERHEWVEGMEIGCWRLDIGVGTGSNTSSSDDSIGVQLDLGLEIVQAIIGPPYHSLGTIFGPSCKCVCNHYPAGR